MGFVLKDSGSDIPQLETAQQLSHWEDPDSMRFLYMVGTAGMIFFQDVFNLHPRFLIAPSPWMTNLRFPAISNYSRKLASVLSADGLRAKAVL